jgi:hypothetical protein
MWNGTAEEYYNLYDITAKYLKEKHPNIKVGGYASMGFQAITDTPERLAENPRHQYQLDCLLQHHMLQLMLVRAVQAVRLRLVQATVF